jgi:hypothetical protein
MIEAVRGWLKKGWAILPYVLRALVLASSCAIEWAFIAQRNSEPWTKEPWGVLWYLAVCCVPVFAAVMAFNLVDPLVRDPKKGAALDRIKDEDVRYVADNLRKRSLAAQVTSIGTVLLILVTLTSGLAVYVNAGAITRLELHPKLGGAAQVGGTDHAETDLPITSPTVVSTIATRVGALALIFFLVQVLVPLFRYSTRLSAFYSSRADAIHLLSAADLAPLAKHAEVLDKVAEILFPANLTFGKEPRTPLSDLAAVAGETAKKVSPAKHEA